MGKYQVGDRVRVLPYEDIKRQFVNTWSDVLPSGVSFPNMMSACCGREYEIIGSCSDAITDEGVRVGCYSVRETMWLFTDEMLEDVDFPAVDISMPFDELLE